LLFGVRDLGDPQVVHLTEYHIVFEGRFLGYRSYCARELPAESAPVSAHFIRASACKDCVRNAFPLSRAA
jgi:hypothetical protein